MDRQYVTLSLPKSLLKKLKKVKMIAASSNKSLSSLLKKSLEEEVKKATGFNKAKNRQPRLIETEAYYSTWKMVHQ